MRNMSTGSAVNGSAANGSAVDGRAIDGGDINGGDIEGAKRAIDARDAELQVSRLLNGVDLRTLDPVQRVLLTTDGTLTDTLEVALLEPIRLVKIGQRIVAADPGDAWLAAPAREAVLERRIMLRGARTGRDYVYAESRIAIDRLAGAFRHDLLNSNLPLGRLWLEHRLETYKEMLEVYCTSDPRLPADFGAPGVPVLGRIYRVYAGGRPVMVITEQFPLTFTGTED